MLAAIIASVIGLSCAGCLSSSQLPQQQIEPQQVEAAVYRDTYSGYGDPSLIRLPTSDQPHNSQSYIVVDRGQYQQNIQSGSSFYSPYTPTSPSGLRPLGEVSGIDLTIAEFAQANSSSHTSPLNYDREWREYDRQRIDAEYTFVAGREETGFGLDLSVSPRVSVDTSGSVRTTRAGAEVRVGSNLDLRGEDAKTPSWYMFAGADGEAVIWDVQNTSRIANGPVTLQDKVTVGDVQAGIGFESPAGNMSISYIQREYEYRNGEISRSGEEDFVAVTLTWRH